jgi:hypothetical protein
VYEVLLEAEPGLADVLASYMVERHIPAIFATGCFRRIRFDRAGSATFRTSYEGPAQDLERYLRDHTAAFRADFNAHFPNGVIVTRITWGSVAAWP